MIMNTPPSASAVRARKPKRRKRGNLLGREGNAQASGPKAEAERRASTNTERQTSEAPPRNADLIHDTEQENQFMQGTPNLTGRGGQYCTTKRFKSVQAGTTRARRHDPGHTNASGGGGGGAGAALLFVSSSPLSSEAGGVQALQFGPRTAPSCATTRPPHPQAPRQQMHFATGACA